MEWEGQQEDQQAILDLIARESAAFWDKDFEAWSECWVQAPYIRFMGWYAAGGISYQEGWDVLGSRTREHMAKDPLPNPNAARVRRENMNIRIYRDSAWVTFDQYGVDTGQVTFDMPGLSRETRILEKQDGKWKFVYVNYLLEGNL